MIMTREQHQIHRELVNGLKQAKDEAGTKYLEKKCNVVAVTFEERPFAMATAIMKPIKSCPNVAGCNTCNDCGYYVSHDKEKGVVYCMKAKQVNQRRKLNKANAIRNQK